MCYITPTALNMAAWPVALSYKQHTLIHWTFYLKTRTENHK